MSTDRPHPGALDLPRIQFIALIAGGVGTLLCVVGFLVNPAEFFRSYLVAFCFVLGLGAGSLAVLMLQFLTGGGWGLVLRRLLEASTRTLPLLAVAFVPLACGVYSLYRWTEPGEVSADKAHYYLNVPFFLARAAFYFVVWIGVALVFNRMSRREDQASDPGLERRFRMLGAPGLVLYGLTMTFAAVDWGMSLEPDWYSTMYPPLWAFGQILTAFSFMVAAVVLLGRQEPFQDVLNRGHLRDLGSLLLAFVMLWAYLAFSQFMLIWTGNLQEEVPWYLRRLEPTWRPFGFALILGHFALPFLLLLSTDVKQSSRWLPGVAGLVLLMRYIDLYWVLKPPLESEEFPLLWIWLDLAALVAVGGLWLAFFVWQLRRMPLLPLNDPRIQELATDAHHESIPITESGRIPGSEVTSHG